MTISSPVERSRPQCDAGDQESRLKRVLFVLGLDPAGKFGSIEEQVFTLSRAFHERSGLFLPVFLHRSTRSPRPGTRRKGWPSSRWT